MREGLTILAATIVALLCVALGGPWLVDWTAHRGLIDGEISRAIGMTVSTRGAIDLKLLPTPYLALNGVEASAPGLEWSAGKTRLELQVMPLIRGEIRFYVASIDSLDLTIRAPLEAAVPTSDARFDRVSLTNGRLRVIDSAGVAKFTLSGVDLEGEAESLRGPFKGAGGFDRDGKNVAFQFATGAVENGGMRVKFVSSETDGVPHADLEGVASLDTAGNPVFSGQAAISAASPAPWRVSGPLKIDANGAGMEKLDVRIDPKAGTEGGSLTLQGAARLDFATRLRLALDLSARQLDFDAFAGNPALAAARDALGKADAGGRAPFAIEATLTTPAAQLGGETLTNVHGALRLNPGVPAGVDFSADGGPGGSRLAMSGAVETGAAAEFRGRIDMGARNLPRLADWLAQWSPEDAARLRGLPVGSLAAKGDFSLSGAGFSAANLAVKADRTLMTGAAAFTRALGGEPARFFADLSSDAFDLETAPDLSGPAAALADADLSILLDARAIRVARFGDGAIDAGHIHLKLKRESDLVHLDELAIDDLGGATVRATGEANGKSARLNASVSADRLGELATFLRRIAPGPMTDALAARATALSPTKLVFHVEANRDGSKNPFIISSFGVDGMARGTAVKAVAKPEGKQGALTASASLESQDAAMLLRQIGLDGGVAANAGPARVDLTARGAPASGFELHAKATTRGAAVDFIGNTVDLARAAGDLAIDASDAAPALRLLGFGLPDATLKPTAKLTARIDASQQGVAFKSIAGSIAGSDIAGELQLSPDETARGANKWANAHWTGALRLDRLSAPTIAQAVLGPERQLKPGEAVSTTPFAAGMAAVPRADIDIAAANLALSAALSASGATFKLKLEPGLAAFENVSADIAGGKLSDGRLSLRRDGAMAAMIGAGSLEGLTISKPGVSGGVSASFDFSATGGSASAMVSGLAGQGKARVVDLAIPRADPAAPARVLARVDSGDLFVSENDFLGALRREFDAAPFKAGDRDFDVTIAGGKIGMTNADGLALSYDLKSGAAESRVQLKTQPLPKDWDGPAPRLWLVWKGPLDNPVRDIDAGAFDAALTARAVAREQARIEAFEADVRERQSFSRRLKGLAFMDKREQEIAAYQAEQERLAREEEKRRAAEAARLEAERIVKAKADADKAERDRKASEARAAAARAAVEAERKQPASPFAPAPLDISPLAHPATGAAPQPGTDPAAAGRY